MNIPGHTASDFPPNAIGLSCVAEQLARLRSNPNTDTNPACKSEVELAVTVSETLSPSESSFGRRRDRFLAPY